MTPELVVNPDTGTIGSSRPFDSRRHARRLEELVVPEGVGIRAGKRMRDRGRGGGGSGKEAMELEPDRVLECMRGRPSLRSDVV